MIELGVEAAELVLGVPVGNVATGKPGLGVCRPEIVLAELELLVEEMNVAHHRAPESARRPSLRVADSHGSSRIPIRQGPPRPRPAGESGERVATCTISCSSTALQRARAELKALGLTTMRVAPSAFPCDE